MASRSRFIWASRRKADARDGQELRLVWGEENGGTSKRNVESHVQTDIRVTVSTRPL